METPRLPNWILTMLRWICPAELFETIEGDLMEQFAIDVQRFGKSRARRRAIIHSLDFMRLGIISRNRKPSFNAPMTIHFFRFFFRGLKRHAGYSFINISGLSLGLATVLLIMIYVVDETSYDRFHKDHEKIFRVVSTIDMGGEVMNLTFTPNALSNVIHEEYPQVEYITRASFFGQRPVVSAGTRDIFAKGLAADPDFFNIFQFEVIEGNITKALDDESSIIITKNLAIKLFGQYHDVVDRMLPDGQRVTAVLEDIPDNSHLLFDFVKPFMKYPPEMSVWHSFGSYHYVKFRDVRSVPEVQQSLQALMMNHLSTDTRTAGLKATLDFQPLSSIHLGEISYSMEPGGKGSRQYVAIFSVLAIFVLAIACINFTNLATVRGIKRAKEIGLRKTVGAVRFQLVLQLLGESMIAAVIAMSIAMGIAALALEPFNVLVQKNIGFSFQSFGIPLVITFGAMIISGVLSGIYPALVLSSVKPASLIRGKVSASTGGGLLSKSLVVLQFAFSIMIISGTLIVYSQLQYIRNKNLGFKRDNVIRIHSGSKNFTSFKAEMQQQPGIRSVTAADQNLIEVDGAGGVEWSGGTSTGRVLVHTLDVDADFVETMEISIVKGRNFIAESKTDTATVLINEEAARLVDVDDPIGLKIRGLIRGEATVVGVIKDFHFKSIHEKMGPLVLLKRNSGFYTSIMIRVEGDVQQDIAAIEKTWKKFNAEDPFIFSFIDDDFDAMYRAEAVTETVFKVFAGLGIAIACLGLFGLSSYTVEMKNREYSIRKVFGAASSSLFYASTIRHLMLVAVATIVAAPLAYYFSVQWLNTFAYHADLSVYPFVIAGVISIALAFGTVAYQSARLALTKPSTILRAE